MFSRGTHHLLELFEGVWSQNSRNLPVHWGRAPAVTGQSRRLADRVFLAKDRPELNKCCLEHRGKDT